MTMKASMLLLICSAAVELFLNLVYVLHFNIYCDGYLSFFQLMKTIGNENSNNFWEWNSTEDDRIDSDVEM